MSEALLISLCASVNHTWRKIEDFNQNEIAISEIIAPRNLKANSSFFSSQAQTLRY